MTPPPPPATGPLAGLKVLEFQAIGPVPLAGMILSDLGADVVCVARPRNVPSDPRQIVSRGRRWTELDLKSVDDVARARALMAQADVVLEGFRPGVMERLGLGPHEALAARPSLVYGRMTGWGQEGPLAPRAGHDINYIAIIGALDSIRGSDGVPVAPLNLVGDYGGGAMFLIAGVLSAVISARASGRGQVVDAAMVDGAAVLLSLFHTRAALGHWGEPGTNILDGASHYYGVYRCADGKFMSVGAIEPQFHGELLRILGLEAEVSGRQNERTSWPDLKARLAEVFATRTQADWTGLFEGSDACVAPVVALREAHDHPHLAARGTFLTRDGVVQANAAPRFSHTPAAVRDVPRVACEAQDIAAEWAR
ncbi:MAG: CaiB/BaiF CoA-transferase family protein [Pseudomonadota bacterium]